ncbi:unnamed protein product [Prunus armeniaca]|uniref:Reverse transcriptase domain-containing protein n=1 Tax=Prunus armeniaca TaxID=36596 RepID=A0A6J5XP92_PRUAR|nr:unnamed protein product [Prunus armeniaca]
MGVDAVLECVRATVTSQDNMSLSKPVLEDEVLVVVKQLDPIKSPGPNGFTGSFYQKFWSTIGGDILRLVQSFFHYGWMHKKLNHTHIALIPKVTNPRRMTQWRPISLCNVVYKIISKVLTNRLKKVIPHVVSLNQSAFVAERQITDNILVVHEILHSLKIARGSDIQFMAMKLDMAKAYDRVEWVFLEAMMEKLGVLLNGEPSGQIAPCRGLRQGDPLSPFLFLICDEGLTALIRRQEERGLVHGFQFRDRGFQSLTYFFADYSVLFCRATEQEARYVPEDCVGICLSCCISKGRTGLIFDSVRRNISARLHGWAEQFLSTAGKEVLIKAVAMAMPNHAMSCFKLPVRLCREIESEIARFWWKTGEDRKPIHWVGWKQLSLLKKDGGLGFRDLVCFNLAMLAKIGWRILGQPQSLLGRVLHDKYHPGVGFLEARVGRKVS